MSLEWIEDRFISAIDSFAIETLKRHRKNFLFYDEDRSDEEQKSYDDMIGRLISYVLATRHMESITIMLTDYEYGGYNQCCDFEHLEIAFELDDPRIVMIVWDAFTDEIDEHVHVIWEDVLFKILIKNIALGSIDILRECESNIDFLEYMEEILWSNDRDARADILCLNGKSGLDIKCNDIDNTEDTDGEPHIDPRDSLRHNKEKKGKEEEE